MYNLTERVPHYQYGVSLVLLKRLLDDWEALVHDVPHTYHHPGVRLAPKERHQLRPEVHHHVVHAGVGEHAGA